MSATQTSLAATSTPDRVIPTSDPRWERLRRIVEEKSLMRGDFTLTSGRQSKYLFQIRQTTLHPEGSSLIGEIIVEFMKARQIRFVGGLELGAVPIVSVAAAASFRLGYDVGAFFVRKEPKKHGAKELVDGYVPDRQEILAVDDVTTTGGSMMKAIMGIAGERQCTVRWALSIVDREEGGRENLASQGIELVSILRKSDFEI